jgi:hypothetical protein
VPCVDGSELARLFFTFAGWSVQPCVRPVSAAHKAAGHNALRGSGPGQKPAFDNAVAHVVVLIAGSTGSAFRAVRPPNLHITPNVGAIKDQATGAYRYPWKSGDSYNVGLDHEHVDIVNDNLFAVPRALNLVGCQ